MYVACTVLPQLIPQGDYFFKGAKKGGLFEGWGINRGNTVYWYIFVYYSSFDTLLG